MSLDALTRDRVLRLAGVNLPQLETRAFDTDFDERGMSRRHPYPGQHYKHGWIPMVVDPIEVLNPESAAQDYGDELDRVDFDGGSVVARSEGALTVETDLGDGHATIHAAPSPAEAQQWADYIDDGLDLEPGESTHEHGITVIRTDGGLALRWPDSDPDAADVVDEADLEELDGVDLSEDEVPDFTQALRDMAYVTEDNKTVPDEEDSEEPEPDAAMMRHRQLQLLGVELRAFDTAKHPHYAKGVAEGKGGQFRPIAAQIGDALKQWLSGGGHDPDPLKGFSQPQLKKAAEQLGLNPPKGMRLVPLKGLLMQHARGGKPDVPDMHAKNAPAASFDAPSIAAKLRSATSREQAHELLSGLSVPQLKAVNAEVGASFAGVSKKDQIRVRLVEHTVGHRLNTATLAKGGWSDEHKVAAEAPTVRESVLGGPMDSYEEALHKLSAADVKRVAEELNVPKPVGGPWPTTKDARIRYMLQSIDDAKRRHGFQVHGRVAIPDAIDRMKANMSVAPKVAAKKATAKNAATPKALESVAAAPHIEKDVDASRFETMRKRAAKNQAALDAAPVRARYDDPKYNTKVTGLDSPTPLPLSVQKSVTRYMGSPASINNPMRLTPERLARTENDPAELERKTRIAGGHVREIDKAMAASPLQTDAVVYRGVPGERVHIMNKWLDEAHGGGGTTGPRDFTGLTWTDGGFVSTSASKEYARGAFADAAMRTKHRPILMRVVVPKGTGALQISTDKSGLKESELLLDRGLTYRVVADHGSDDGPHMLDVEVVTTGGLSGGPAVKAAAAMPRQELSALGVPPTPLVDQKIDSLQAKRRYETDPARKAEIDRQLNKLRNPAPAAKAAPKTAKPDRAQVKADFAEATARPMPSDRERFKHDLMALTVADLKEINGGPLGLGTKQEKVNQLIEHKIGYRLNSETIRHGVGYGDNDRNKRLAEINAAMQAADSRGDRAEYGRLHQQRLALDADSAPKAATPTNTATVDETAKDRAQRLAEIKAAKEALAPTKAPEPGDVLKAYQGSTGGFKDMREPDGVDKARERQADIDKMRPRADLLSEAEELLNNEASNQTLASRLDATARRLGIEDDPILARVHGSVAAGHAPARIRQEIDAAAQRLGLEKVGDKPMVPFDRKQHDTLTKGAQPGQHSWVIRPGYAFTRNGERIQLSKAKVESATSGEIQSHLGSPVAGPSIAGKAPVVRSLPRSGRVWNWETIQHDNMTMHGDSASMNLAQALHKAGREDDAQYVADMRYQISNNRGEHSPDDVETMVADLKAMMEREPDPNVRALYQRALRDIDAPATPPPTLPAGTPAVLRQMVDELNKIPNARRSGHFAGGTHDVSAVDRLAAILEKVDAGDGGSAGTAVDEIRRALRSLHESVDGAFQMWRLEKLLDDPEIRKWVRSHYPTRSQVLDPEQRDRVLAMATRAAGQDITPGHDQLHHYWTRGEGLAKWRTSPHPWTTLRDHLLKYVSPHKATLMASKWFEEVFGYTAGSDLHRIDSGKPPRGKLVGPG